MKSMCWHLSASLVAAALILTAAAFTWPGDARGQQFHKGEWRLPDHYPPGFTGWGRIDRIGEDDIVINDVQYRLSPSVTFNSVYAADVPSTWFEKGQGVGYLLNGSGEIRSLWQLGDGH